MKFMTNKREKRCWAKELDMASYYRRNPFNVPDGSFMRSMFTLGYQSALRDQKKPAKKK